jgi:hypothetical protein
MPIKKESEKVNIKKIFNRIFTSLQKKLFKKLDEWSFLKQFGKSVRSGPDCTDWENSGPDRTG